MVMISAVLYFLSQHRVLSVLLIAMVIGIAGTVLARVTKNDIWYIMWAVGFGPAVLSVFFMSSLNALFLATFGTYGSAVITHQEQTRSQLNNQYIWRYDALVKTSRGSDVVTGFDTMSASLYPPRNVIDIPPVGERFVVKYIPGFERNVVIMRDESTFGRRLLIQNARMPVDRAQSRWLASPGNSVFQAEYRNALRQFLERYEKELLPDQAIYYRDELGRLNGAKPSSR